jgi:hypothetical protein
MSREFKSVCGSQQQGSIYEKVSIRFNRSSSGSFAAQPERSSALGLLPSRVWLPPRLLASPLLASGLLVCWLLAPGLLVPWSSNCCGPVLICLHLKAVHSVIAEDSQAAGIVASAPPSGASSGSRLLPGIEPVNNKRQVRSISSKLAWRPIGKPLTCSVSS